MKSLELFAGIGGIALASEWAGVETVAFCEREPFCQKVLNKHWPDVPIFDDVKTLNKQVLEERGINVETIELISGGYPCQPFSIAGERRGEDDDRHLWPEVKRILQEIRPTWFIGENVAGHITLGLDQVLLDLESIGYTWQPFVISASSVNAPHRRERVFIIAHVSDTSSIGHKRVKRLQKNVRKIEKGRKSSSRSTSKLFDDIDWKERATQSCFLGRHDGVSNRVDRIRALGNAVVPQQIYPIFKYIMEIERMNNQ
jgi:DNA (cytosine-5)-methyltransferase 1